MTTFNVAISRGATGVVVALAVRGDLGVIRDVAGWSFSLAVTTAAGGYGDPVYTIAGTIISAENGLVGFKVSEADATDTEPGTYYHTITAVDPDLVETEVATGTWEVIDETWSFIGGKSVQAAQITDVEIAAANKDGIAGTPSMRTLGTGAAQAAAGDHGHAGIYQPIDAELTAIAGLSTIGLVERTGAGTAAIRALGSAAATDVLTRANGDGRYASASHSHADPWTYVVLAADFATSLATPQNVDNGGGDALKFTPAASKTYIVEGQFMTQSASSGAIAARPGMTWPTGLSHGGARMSLATTAAAELLAHETAGNALALNLSSQFTGAAGWIGTVTATFVTGDSPLGDIQITLKSESAGTTVTIKAGSWIRYRTIP